MKIIEDENYKVLYEPEHHSVVFTGVLRLGGMGEYAPIAECLEQAVTENTELTLSLKALEFLNSSGIAMLSKFVISARNKEDFKLNIVGSSEITWQGKSLKNLQRLMPSLSLVLE